MHRGRHGAGSGRTSQPALVLGKGEIWNKANKWRVINRGGCEGKRPITKESQQYRIADPWRRVGWCSGCSGSGIGVRKQLLGSKILGQIAGGDDIAFYVVAWRSYRCVAPGT